ncbi:MAG: YifB family Mg chelatase-like AAA ATPase [Cyanobacteriota bacterium]|nr:YifB family Mg chelatase-like AAA ATPase [Cyanobacteriota bacterium]
MFAQVTSATLLGLKGIPITVEVDIGGGLPQMVLVGLPDSAVQESKERVRAAIKNSGLALPQRKIIINLAPADLKKEGPSFDLPIALGILAAAQQIPLAALEQTLFLGELSLDGSLRSVAGVLPIAAAAERMGYRCLVVPAANALEGGVVAGLAVYGLASLAQVVEYLHDPSRFSPLRVDSQQILHQTPPRACLDLADVKGQEHARRALEVAAAGDHNLLLVGSPGAGKTMLAKRLPSILPPLHWEEVLEITQIYSAAGLLRQGSQTSGETRLITERPFRAPHHSASSVALVGGGSYPKPGEISLAHKGTLYLDELTEFKREVLEVLRQPLEEGVVTISRAKLSLEFPAQSMLVASTNPCPCGFYGDPVHPCTCTVQKRETYWAKLSGPLLDRIDLHVRVNRLKPEEIVTSRTGESSQQVRERVMQARHIQQQRFQGDPTISCNAHMQSAQIREWCHLDAACQKILEGAIRKLGLSARGSDRMLKVARTIADLSQSPQIQASHIAEAIQYRSLDRSTSV